MKIRKEGIRRALILFVALERNEEGALVTSDQQQIYLPAPA
jgi:hypothetical protein